MKKSTCCSHGLLIVALCFTIFSGCETSGTSSSTPSASTMASADSGRLIIRRIADLGTMLILNVSIDGKQVGTLSRGQTYNGSVSPGPHVVSVIPEPNDLRSAPPQKSITVQKGQTYTFTAAWQGDSLVLQ